MSFKKITESPSHYRHLEKMSVHELLENINKEDKKVPATIAAVIPQIEMLINPTLKNLYLVNIFLCTMLQSNYLIIFLMQRIKIGQKLN